MKKSMEDYIAVYEGQEVERQRALEEEHANERKMLEEKLDKMKRNYDRELEIKDVIIEKLLR